MSLLRIKLYIDYYLDRFFGHRWYVTECAAHPTGLYFFCRRCGATRGPCEFINGERCNHKQANNGKQSR